ncbi:unnamed protein product [Cercospora beticola]|nr:unnamed protein product [Cercospora beticola]
MRAASAPRVFASRQLHNKTPLCPPQPEIQPAHYQAIPFLCPVFTIKPSPVPAAASGHKSATSRNHQTDRYHRESEDTKVALHHPYNQQPISNRLHSPVLRLSIKINWSQAIASASEDPSPTLAHAKPIGVQAPTSLHVTEETRIG